MVRLTVPRPALPMLAALLLPLAASFEAAAADWRPAGGPLFAGARSSDETVAPLSEAETPSRLPNLDQPFAAAVAEAATRHGLDPKLLHAVVAVESAYRANAVSAAGAAGLTQLMPGTAAELGVADRFDPVSNLRGGADYLARQLMRFGDLRLALAAYNAGPARVARLGRAPEIPETRAYVGAVVECYLALTAGRGVRGRGDCRPAEVWP